jgi:uncharacterized protein (TIGR02466 family)
MSEKVINSIFPTPVWIETIENGVSSEALDYFLNLEQSSNIGNTKSANSSVLESPVLSSLKSEFERAVQQFTEAVYAPSSEIYPYITQSWVNYTQPGQFHHSHKHPNSFISGIFYIQVSSEEDKIFFNKDNDGFFSIPTENFNLFNSSAWHFPVKNNQLLIFPSNLSHSVKHTTSTETRISLSFNTFLKGNLGDRDGLTFLEL